MRVVLVTIAGSSVSGECGGCKEVCTWLGGRLVWGDDDAMVWHVSGVMM